MNAIGEHELRARLKTLPALPSAVLELSEALRGDDVPTDRIVRAIGGDPALTLSALRLANSSFYGVSDRVVTLRDAVQILGLHMLSSAVMTAAVMAVFDRKACPAFDFDASWRHAIATALCAQMLAQSRGIDGCTAYTAGLLHDIGRLALATHFPQQHAVAIEWAAEHDASPIEAERAVLGLDHAQVGAMIATHWRLAPNVIEAIGHHHDIGPECPEGAAQNSTHALLDVLHLADNITHALDLSREPDEMVPALSIAAWERVRPTGEELQQVFARIEARVQDFGGAFPA